MTDAHAHAAHNPIDHPEVQQATARGYISGYALTVILLGVGLIGTTKHIMPPQPLLVALSVLAVFLLISQSLLFFGLSFSRSNVWKTVSLVLTVPLFILSIGLTVWMFHSLDTTTMIPQPEMPGMSMQPTTLQ